MASVDGSNTQISLDGSCKMVPTNCQFVWLRFTQDKKWTSQFQQALVNAWRSQNSLDQRKTGDAKPRKGVTVNADAAATDASGISSLGDVAMKKWCCTRTHQVLTRVFLAAEKYDANSATLLFSAKEEAEYQRTKKERALLLEDICSKRLEEAGSNHLRDWLNRLWVLFVTGIDNDPAGQRALSYDVRKSVHDAQFTNEDAIYLQASLLAFLFPSLKYETCFVIAAADFQAAPLVKPAELTGFESSQRRSTPPQQLFTHVFINFLGSFLDTLTEAEIVKAATIFKAAVWDAQQRILQAPKHGPGGRKKSEDVSIVVGDGIHIDHLDKLGRRKRIQKFA